MQSLDNKINTILTETGLSPSEREVYIVGLQNGMQSSNGLGALTGMPRPTLMAALKILREHSLCQVTKRDGRSLTYTMQPVSTLKTMIGERIRKLDSVMEELDNIELSEQASLKIKEMQGKEALKDALELALRCKSREWQIIAPRDNALAHMSPAYINYFKKVRKERQIISQTLWDEQWQSSHISLHDLLMRKPRFIPTTVSEHIPTMLLACDDLLIVIDGTTNPVIAILQSKTVVDTYRLIFELAWRSCRQ